MNLLDENNYLFLNQEIPNLKFKHKYLVPGTETEELGMVEEWSVWTEQNTREFAFSNGVDVVQTRSQRA